MNFIKRVALRVALSILDSGSKLKFEKNKAEEWLFENYEKEGWRNYFEYRNTKLLKDMGMGVAEREYVMLVGRRFELLTINDDMRRIVENRKTADEKKAAEAEKKERKVRPS